MPAKHIEKFTVRFYECDAYGHLNNANYLRYMQEAAFQASADVGLDYATYRKMGKLWLIRESEIEYLRPIRADDEIEVHTWVIDVRRVISRRAYQFIDPESDEILARGYSDWVFIERDSLRPASIPAQVSKAYIPEGGKGESVTRQPFPIPPPPPAGAFSLKRWIDWRDLDGMRHLTNAAYLSYAEDCAMRLAASFGWPFSRWQEEGIAFVARKNRIKYHQAARFDDELKIETWLYDLRAASATRYYTFTRAQDDTLLAQLQTHWVLINFNTGKPTRFPAHFHEILRPNIAE
ncbi:MAG: thioesterase [Anaerolineales bacterium]|jgi:acyl-CoA thioester hydrolase